jgi:hypothetical protein
MGPRDATHVQGTPREDATVPGPVAVDVDARIAELVDRHRPELERSE